MDGDWKAFVGEWLGKTGQPGGFDREPLAGDASNRRYFRVKFSEGVPSTAVLMQKNAGEGFKKSEEAVSKAAEDPPGDPFILIARFLAANGIPVPELYHVRESGELVLQEDLGEHTLAGRLSQSPGETKSLTERTLSLLVALQKVPWKKGIPWLSGRTFSRELIRWEFEHFVEYGLAGAPDPALSRIRDLFDRESAFLARETSPVLVHRDYHSRNIMVREDGRLALIDFQDLLLGSPFYDLASFLFDPYRSLSMDEIRGWLDLYLARAIAGGVLPADLSREEASELLFRHGFQRNLKACGRFFYIADVKGNPSFLGSVSGTHKNLERLARTLPALTSVYEEVRPFRRNPTAKKTM